MVAMPPAYAGRTGRGMMATTIDTYSTTAVKGMASAPIEYRLRKKSDGTYVLQGAFEWWQGALSGIEWRDLETVEGEG
jgi:hypothetical protein